MSNEKRFALFVVLMFAWLLGFPYILKFLGLNPPPPQKKAPAIAAGAPKAEKEAPGVGEAKAREAAAEKAAPGAPAEKAAAAEKSRAPQVALVDARDLVLGSTSDKSPTGYRLELQL